MTASSFGLQERGMLMGNIYCIMGKSASGKDTIYKRLLDLQPVSLRSIVTYTTRPIRSEEQDGVEYKFVTFDALKKMRKQGVVIEERCYHTVHGDWYYFFDEKGRAIPVGADGYPEDYSFPGGWTLYDHEGNPVLHKTEGEIPTID